MSEAGSESHVVHASLAVSLEVPLSGVSLIRRTLVNERSKHAPATKKFRTATIITELANAAPVGGVSLCEALSSALAPVGFSRC